MSKEEEIEQCVKACSPDVIFHTNSTYPSPVSELNLSYITWLKEKYPHSFIGYSGHEYGLVPTFAAVVMGARYVERHITLDRTAWGSDQMASVEPAGLIKMTKAIRDIESAIGDGGPRTLLEGEKTKRTSLRK
jgi:N-acetylneuraminate synthase